MPVAFRMIRSRFRAPPTGTRWEPSGSARCATTWLTEHFALVICALSERVGPTGLSKVSWTRLQMQWGLPLSSFGCASRMAWAVILDRAERQKDLDIAEYTDPDHNPMIPHT